MFIYIFERILWSLGWLVACKYRTRILDWGIPIIIEVLSSNLSGSPLLRVGFRGSHVSKCIPSMIWRKPAWTAPWGTRTHNRSQDTIATGRISSQEGCIDLQGELWLDARRQSSSQWERKSRLAAEYLLIFDRLEVSQQLKNQEAGAHPRVGIFFFFFNFFWSSCPKVEVSIREPTYNQRKEVSVSSSNGRDEHYC